MARSLWNSGFPWSNDWDDLGTDDPHERENRESSSKMGSYIIITYVSPTFLAKLKTEAASLFIK